MPKKLTAAAVLAALLVTGLGSTLAASGGSAQPGGSADPFVHLSYLTDTYYSQVEQSMLERAQSGTQSTYQAAADKLEQLTDGYLTQAGGQSYSPALTRRTLVRGDKLTLAAGASLLFEGGLGTLTADKGELVDVTAGGTVSSGGKLTAGHRYVAGEGSSCTFAVTSDAAVLSVAGYYSLAQSGLTGLTPFTDLSSTDWYYDCVSYAYEHSLFQGVSAAVFSPSSSMTRAMLATVLGRLAGADLSHTDSGFTDVSAGSWYAGAVTWAANAGIVTGMGNGAFAPDSSVTREQMAVMLYRYAGSFLGLELTQTGDLSPFSDRTAVSSWAEQAMAWAVGAGILNGYDDGRLAPGGTATRAEVAAMLQRFSALLP